MGKGDKIRLRSPHISREQYEDNYARIFKKDNENADKKKATDSNNGEAK